MSRRCRPAWWRSIRSHESRDRVCHATRASRTMIRRYVTPGRVELVGKHVDYGGGPSLTCAVDLTMRATARPIAARTMRVQFEGSHGAVEVPIVESARYANNAS